VLAASGFAVEMVESLEDMSKALGEEPAEPIVLIDQDWLEENGLDTGRLVETCQNQSRGVVLLVPTISELASTRHDPNVTVVVRSDRSQLLDSLFQMSGATVI